MADQRPVTALDPPHITEFASERYFEKLSQLNASQQNSALPQASPRDESSHATTTVVSPSTFILPLRAQKVADNDTPRTPDAKREKGRFFSIRNRVPLRLPKSPLPIERAPLTPTPPATLAARKSLPLDQSILALPNELQVHILASLPLTDVLNLRLSSKTWHALITVNEAQIARYHLHHHIPAYALRLYPISSKSEVNLHYICSLWHRLHVAAKLAFLMCEWITKEIFLRQTDSQRAAFVGQQERMRRRLIPLLFTIFHFFEMHRKLHLKHITDNNGSGLQKLPFTLNPIEVEIMKTYDDQTLLRVHEVFPLVISSFCRRLRPPTYVGRVERSLRGYLREKPSDELHAALLCIGGIRQVERLWEIKGYNSRRAAVDTWYNALIRDHPSDTPGKARRGLKAFGRKKSMSGDRPATRHSLNGDEHRSNASSAPLHHDDSSYDTNWIFNTSLVEEAPMAQLRSEQAQKLLDDLPVLQHIWLATAEALILDRGIVQRPQDIKRNQQVMLDLIREDGLDEEDECWYGRSIADLVRPPPPGAIVDDDAD